MMKRKLSIILLLAMTLTQFSCGGDGKTPTDTDEGLDTSEQKGDEYPIEVRDFGGAEFGILCRTDKIYEIMPTGDDGETLNDAIWKRNMNVEDRYKIKIKCYDTAGAWGDRENFYNYYSNSILSDEKLLDLVAYYEATSSTPTVEGMMYNLLEIDSLDLSNPWWYPGYNEPMTVNGKLYSCLGDIAMTTWEYPVVEFFNKKMMDEYKMEYPYQLVKDGKWTFDTMIEMAKQVSDDLNGDGVYDENDKYGWVTSTGPLRCVPTEQEFPLSTREGNTLKLSIGSERYIEMYDKLYGIIWDNDFATVLQKGDDAARTKLFTDGNVLFYNFSLADIASMRQMQDEFGILPSPKYDENQENYHTVVFDNHSVMCVPMNVSDPERAGLILEALCYESMNLVTPAYYDIILQGKTARDDASNEMLDIICDSFQFDFAIVNSLMLDGVFTCFGNNLVNKVESISSKMASQMEVWNTKFEALMEFYNQ